MRFAQSLGYRGFKKLQALFRKRLATAAPGFEARVKALETKLKGGDDLTWIGFLRDLVVCDIASLQQLLDEMNPKDLALAADLMDRADIIHLIGQLRASPVVGLLRYVLTMMGKRGLLLDPEHRLATHIGRSIRKTDVLLAVSFRFHATEVVNVVEEAGQKGIAIIAISDSTRWPLARWARVLFPVPEHDHTFSRSLSCAIR